MKFWKLLPLRRTKNGRQSQKNQELEFQLEQLEPRVMLDASLGNVVFQANFEDVNVEPNQFGFFREVSGMTATGRPVEIQNNHPSVGPASEGQQHLELDGVSGIAVDIVSGSVEKLLLQVDYSARPGVDADQSSIEVYWNGELLDTLSADGTRLRSTRFQQFEIEIPTANGRLEFRSNSPNDNLGLGGLIDDVKVIEQLGPIQISGIADQELFLNDQLELTATLLPPNQNVAGLTYSLNGAPAGMEIDSSTGVITWTASQTNIDNSNNTDDEVIIGDPELVFQSGFEDVDVASGGFGFFSETSGFTASPRTVEVQNNHPSVGGPSEGQNHIELDGVNSIFRDVNTIRGDQYELVFDYSPRPGVSQANNAIEIWWDGERLDTVSSDGRGLRRTRFETFRFDVSEFAGDLTRLEFRSNSPDDLVGLGGLLDNIRLVRRPVEIIEGTTGKYEVTVSVVDQQGRTDSETFQVCVVEGTAVAPILSEIADVTIDETQPLNLTLTTTDPDSNAAQLTYELIAGPTGASMDEATGQVSWAPTESDGPGEFDFEVKVTDQSNLSDTVSFKVIVAEVNQSPLLDPVADQTVTEGQSLSFFVNASDADLPANELTFSIASGPAGASVDEVTGEFSFAPMEDQAGSTFTTEILVEDKAGGSDTVTFDIEVIALPDRQPSLAVIADQTVNEGEQLEVFVVATDPDTPTDELTFTVESGPVGLNVDATTGQLTWTPAEGQGPGVYEVTVKVTDETNLSDSATFEITVVEVNVAPVLAAIEDQTILDGESISLTVVATDPDLPANTLTYAIDTGPANATIDPVTGEFNWTPTAAQTPGVYDVTVSVSDGSGGADTETFQIRVNVENESPVLAAIEDQSIDENAELVVLATATDADLPPQTITFTLEVSPAGATIDAMTGEIKWTPGEADGPGVYDFTVVASDSEGAEDRESFQVTVNEVNVPPVLAAIADQTVVQNALLEFTASATDTDVPANSLTYGFSGLIPDGLTIDPTSGLVSWTPTDVTSIGEYNVIVTVSDGNGGSDMTSVKITVTPPLDGILLFEGDDFEVLHQESIEITNQTTELVFRFAEDFDTTDTASINDAFEVALLDQDGNSLVHTFNQSRDAFFNLTEGESIAAGVNTIVDGSTVKLDLSHIAEGTSATLVFRLVNNDSDTQTQVRIRELETTNNLLNTPIGASFTAQAAASDIEVDFAGLTDVTGSLEFSYGETSFDAESSRLYSDIQVTNRANHPIDGPFLLVVHSITDPNVTVVGSDGGTPEGNRYYLLEDTSGTNTIERDASTLSRTLEFFNPGGVKFGYQLAVLAQPNVAPEFISTPVDEGEAGVAYSYQAEAIDVDNDLLSFQLMAGPEGLTIDSETGLISWTPETDDIGTHSVIVEVIDGRGGKDMQQYDIEVVEDRPNRPPLIVSSPVVETFLSNDELGPTGNLITNGNFEDGDSGFNSDYAPTGIGSGARAYSITTNPNLEFSLATSYGDSTTGSGNMLAVKGSTTLGDVVWEQTIEVTQNTTYDFATNISSWFPAAPAELTFKVNGETIGELIAPTETGVWELLFATWESGDATEATIQIANGNIVFSGNDFALDDIYFGGPRFSNPSYQYQVEAVDPDLDPLTYELTEAPAGMAINPETGLISWNPTAEQVGTHQVAVTTSDGRGGLATQTYELRVLADPTNTAPVIVSDPVDNFFVPGFSNPASGEVTPQRIALDLGNGESFEGTVSIQLPDSAGRFADIVLAVDESSSMGGSQAWVVEMIPLLDAALIDAGIGAEPESPNRFAIVGFGGGRDSITVGHFLNSESRSKYTLYGPDKTIVAEGLLNDVIPDELLNLELPNNGEYVLVVEAQNLEDLDDGINISFEGNVSAGTRVKQLELDTLVEDILLPGQPVEYQFELPVRSLLYFDSLVKDTRIRWTLEGPKGLVAENAEFTTLTDVRSLDAGQYKLTIDSATTVNSASFADAAAEYKFQVLNLDSGQLISSGETITAEFELKAESFAYRFNAQPNQQFEMVIGRAVAHAGSRWTLVDSEGTVIATDSIGENRPPISLLGGDYFLLMESALSPKEGTAQLRTQSLVEFSVNIENATPPIEIAFGETVEGTIQYIDAYVDYSFTLNERSLTYLDSLVDSGLTWTLTGPAGDEVVNRQFAFTDSFSFGNPVVDLVAGDYLLRVNSNNRTGDFRFSVLKLSDAVEITPGTSFDGELTIPNETDTYRFDANSGDEFYFDVVTASDTANTQYKLIDPYGQIVFVSSSLNDVATTTLTSDGTYTLLVEGWKANTGVDTYTMNVVPVTESTVELTLGTPVSGNLATAGQRIVYTFDLAEDALLYFDSLTNDPVKNWTLVGPRGIEVQNRTFSRSDSFDQGVPAIEVPTGSYQLIVTGADSIGDFSFRLSNLRDTNQSTPITPNPGALNTSVSFSDAIIGPESKIYRFDAESGDEFSFITSVTGSTNASYRILDAYGQNVTTIVTISTDRVNQKILRGGTFFLFVEGRNSNETQSDFTFDINWIQNSGAEVLTGTPLVLNATTNGDISTDGQVDSYTFTLSDRTLLYLDVLTNNSNLRWALKGPKGQFATNVAFTSTDAINSINTQVTAFVPGEYQFDVFGNGTPGEYGFRMVDLSSATAILPGTAFSGQLAPANETDLYQFDANAGDQFYVDVEATSDKAGALYRLIDPYGDVIAVSPSGQLNPLAEPITVATSGSYTLVVEGKSSNVDNDTYTLNVHQVATVSKALTFGEASIATIDKPGNRAAFTFSVADRTLVHFDSLVNSTNVNWTLTGPSGTLVQARKFTQSDASGIQNPILDLPTGDYTLTVDTVSNLTGEFEFVLFDLSATTQVNLGDKVIDRFDTLDGLDAVWTTGAGLTGAAVDGAIDLSRSRDAISIPTETLNGATDYTIEFWYKTNKTGFQTFISGANSSDDNELLIYLNSSTDFRVQGVGIWTIDSVADGQWHHYAITSEEGVGTTLYLDGVNQGLNTRTLGELTLEEGGLFFGQEQDVFAGDFDANQAADGQLDELRIWTLTRTENEILANKDSVVPANSSGLNAYYGFDESSGKIAADQTANGFDATFESLTTSGATKAYQFDSVAGDVVYFDYINFDRNFNLGGFWRLVDQYGSQVFNQSLTSDAGPITLDGGTYVLFVEGFINDTGFNGGYEFDIVYLGNEFDPVAPSELTLGTTVNSEISVVRETDRYSFTISEPITAYFDALTNDNTLNWSLFRDGREVITGRSFDRSDSDRNDNPLLNLRPGEYVLSVTSVEAEPYSFRLLNLGDATEVQLEIPFGNTFAEADQTDLYQFAAEAGDRVYIDVVSVTDRSRVNYRLVGPNSNIIVRQLNFDDNDVVVLEETGDYYLLIEGDYNSPTLSEYEVNLVSANLTVATLTLGETTTDSIVKPGDAFEYQFSLGDDAQVVFDSFTDARNIVWSLDGPLGNIVSDRSFDRSDSFDFGSPVINLESGDYKLTVTGVGDELGDFSFRLLDLASSEVISPGSTIGGGDVEITTETRAYQFSANAGQAFLIDVESASETSTALYRLIDPDGTVVVGSSGLSDVQLTPLARSGTYTLLVEGRRNNVAPTTFSINLIELTERDAGTLPLGVQVSGTLVRGESVSYTLTLDNDGLLHFDSLLDDNNFNWTLTGPRGIEVDSRGFASSDSRSTDGISRPPVALELLAGDYKLTVDAVGDVVGDYAFAVLNLLDPSQSNLVSDPTTGSPTTIDSVQVTPAGTQAFRFDAVAGDQLTFNSAADNSQADYRLIDQYGKQLFRQQIQRNQTTSLLLTGTYFLLVEGLTSNNSVIDYQIAMTLDGNTPIPDLSGDALTLGSPQTGDLAVAGQVDSYTFTLPERSSLYLDVLTNNSTMRWSLKGPRGVELSNIRFDLSNAASDFQNPGVQVLPAGEYQLDISASSGAPGAYGFTLYDLAAATEITLGTEFSGDLTNPLETDIYRFDANAGESFYFDVEPTGNSTTTFFKLIDPFGRVVKTSNRFNDLEAITVEFDGTYSLLVNPLETYTMNVVPVVNPTSALELGKTTTANLATAGATQSYTFVLDQEQSFFFLPGSSDTQFNWTLADRERDIISESGFNTGFGFLDLTAGEYTVTVDSIGDYVGEISFYSTLLGDTDEIATDGTITSGLLNTDNAAEVYSFNGIAGQRLTLLPDFSINFTDSATASETAMKYTLAGDPEDGYSGVAAAIRADVFREGAAVNYILVTDEDRDVEEDEITFESLFSTITNQSALLNIISASQFRDDTNTRAIGVDDEGNAYIADGSGGFTIGTGGYTTQANVSILQDYINLAWATEGANWDLGLLRAGGVTAESFTNAFIDVKVSEILEQTALRLIPSDLDADFELIDPVGGIYTDVVGGQTYDFEIRIGNNGQPISYDLLFNQGQTIGSIPVFIISPYQYGASAVDADGDTLTWSLVSGPEGIVIDEQTGVLGWTADDVVYGEHEITIRVDDGRGGFDEQTFVLSVNGGEAASISGRVADLDSLSPTTFNVIVEGNNNPYLSGLPDGTTANSSDVAPNESPVIADGFVAGLLPGSVLTFDATGGVSLSGGEPASTATPDGDASPTSTHFSGDDNGISSFVAPWNALVGVFLSDDRPNENPAPETLDFSGTGNVEDGINFTTLAPELQQLFFIGDGVNDDGVRQEFTIPEGATRLYLGTTDGFGWFNNTGFFSVNVTGFQYVTPPDVAFTVFLDENRNGLLDDNERSEVTDANGDFTFANLDAGSYNVVQQPLPGWSQAIPATNGFEISVDLGEEVDRIFFGNNQVPLVNTNPVITSEPILNIVAGEAYSYTPTIEEIDGDTLIFDTPLAPVGLAVNPENGTIRWTPSQDQIGTQNVLLRVRDGNGGFDLQYFQVQVAEPNSAPTILSTPPTGPAGVGLPYTYEVRAVDAQEDAISYSLLFAPDGMTIDAVTGVIDWVPNSNQLGVQTITVIAQDDRGLSSEQQFDLTVELNPENVAPVFLSEPPAEVRLGDSYLYRVRTLDQNGDPTTLSLDAGPDGLTLSPEGLIVWQPTPNQLGDQTVRLIVEDGRGGTATQEFTIEVTTQPVNFPPEITSIPLTAAISGQDYRFQATAVDRNNDTLFWTLEQAPLGMAIDAQTGLVTWQPDDDDIGEQDVTVQVTDTYGAFSQLVYKLRVRATNTPPVILSAPPTTAAVGSTYLYQVGAEDVDQDRLTFALIGAPEGMSIDANSGLVQWTPEAGQAGNANVEISVSDSLGASVTQTYTIKVADGQPNQLPVITSTPGFFATVDGPYTYQIEAVDPDGDELTYTLLSSQPGMTVNATTGLLEWTPTAADLGTTIVEIVARDPALGGSIQQFSLTVLEANNAPVITSTPPTELASGQPFRYDILATDADGDFLSFEIVNGPEGMLIDGLGRMFWIPGADQLGDNDVEVRVSDPRGAFATQSFTINVDADTTAPQVVINLSDNPVDVGSMVDIRVQAIDNVGVESLVLTLDGIAVPLDANGNARVELDTVGAVTALATATDAAGNSSTDSVQIFVADPNDVEGPVISITTPGDGDSITSPTDIIGTVFDDTLVSYRLLLAEFGSRDFREIGSGTENVDNDVLGQLDPTLLQNGSYVLRLEAFDAGGNGNVIEQSVEITGELKLGNFQLSFTDMVIPVAGIPIQITRVYDTLQSNEQGEFGFGWRLEFRDTNLQVNLPETGLEDYGIFSAYRPGTRVYLNVPGEGRQGFTFDPIIRTLPGFGNNLVLATPRFTPDRGVTSKLSVGRSGNLIVNQFGELSAGGGIPYNPASPDFGAGFTLTTQEGITYRIDGVSGQLESATDRNGNLIKFSQEGVSAEGIGTIEFKRDAQDRITSIQDLSGKSVQYAYDASGDLLSVTDREGNTTEFEYSAEREHYLVDIVDPLGRDYVRLNYNEDGRLENSTTIRGGKISYTYDPDNFVGEVVDPLGNPFVYEYNQQGNIVSITDALGSQSRFEYDDNGNLVTSIDSLGNKSEFERDIFGNALSSTNPLGSTTRLTYDSNGNLTASIDALGRVTEFAYDEKGNIVQTTNSIGQISTARFDSKGNQISITDVGGNTRSFSYDRFGNVITSIDTLGNVSEFVFDANGQNTGNSVEIKSESGETNTISVSFELDANGNRTASTDAFGNVTKTELDALGNPVALVDSLDRRVEFIGNDAPTPEQITLPTGATLLTEFNLNNQITATTENGQTTQYEFDAVGNIIKRILPDETPEVLSDNPIQEFEYDALRRITAIVDPNGNRTEFEYDAAGNQTVVRDALGNETKTEYDAIGQAIAEIDPLGRRTEYQYDQLGRLTKTTLADGSTLTQEYDKLGNVVKTTDTTGASTAFEYDKEGRLVAVVNANGHRIVYERDQFGNVSRQLDALRRETVFEYDEHSRITATIRPLGQISRTTYTANNKIKTQTAFDGSVSDYQYDDTGRLSKIIYEDGTEVSYLYDDGGNVLRISDQRGSTNFQYDAQNRLIRKTEPDGRFVAYSYDSNSNIRTITTPSNTTTNTYDALNRIKTVTDASGQVTEFQYDEVGNNIQINFGNGTTEIRTFDLLNRLISTELSDSEGTEILSVNYTRDARGLITGINDSNGRVSGFIYDSSLQLIQETHQSPEIGTRTIDYVYDAVGNRISKTDSAEGTTTYSYDSNDRLIQIDGNGIRINQGFDENGNLISTASTSGNSSNYTYDARERLIEANISVDGVTDSARYEYDDLGNRVVRVADGVESRFLFDVNRDFAEAIEVYRDDFTVESSFTYGRGILSSESGGNTHYYQQDAVGSVIQLSDENGDSSGGYIYDSFGNILLNDLLIENDLRFTGEYFDDITGFTYLRARNLDNETARFTSEDPFLGFEESPISRHRYQYANNNPLTFTDPSGEASLAEVAVGLSIVGGLLAIGQQGLRLLADFKDPVVFGGFSVNAAVSLEGGKTLRPSFRGIDSNLSSLSVGASLGAQINVFGSNNLPEFIDQGAFSGKNRLGASTTVFSSAGGTYGPAVSLLENLPFSAGIGGFTVEVPRAFVNRKAPGLSLGGGYALFDITVGVVAGETLASVLVSGFGTGNANGFQISTLIGGGASGALGVTIPFFTQPSSESNARDIQNFTLETVRNFFGV